MLDFRRTEVFAKNKSYLDAQQKLIDQEAVYAKRVTVAKEQWGKKSKPVFDELRKLLESLCPGARRCHYCEDSAADEVEHVWPKSFYPEKTFHWGNYLFACGPCNGAEKGDQFPIFDSAGHVREVVRRRGEPVVPPPAGNPVFLDPHEVNPMDYMELDPATGLFVEIGNSGGADYIRAESTIRILGLNRRDYLSKARRSAFGAYLNSAVQYIERKNAGAPRDELKRRRRELQDYPHPSVWFEIKRLAGQGVAYQDIPRFAPELLAV
jgi:5-methylcytosine-specific restriction endonuclease McrA